MTLTTNRHAASIGEVLEIVHEFGRDWNASRADAELWFRGADRPHALLPALYRETERKARYDEVSLFEAFRALGAQGAPSGVTGEWDWYFLGRHHGLPTRLLDWSTNALAATYFAIEPHVRGMTMAEIDSLASSTRPRTSDGPAPVIWILDALSLNSWSLRAKALVAVSQSLDSMLPSNLQHPRRAPGTWQNRRPIAIVPRHTNSRLLAQAGRFTIHGRQRRAIDAVARRERRVRLARITLVASRLPRMWQDLEFAGVNGATLMRDLDSLTTYIKHTFAKPGSP